MTYTADLEIRFENGSIGARTFRAATKHLAHYDAEYFLSQVIQYAKAKEKNLVTGHTISLRDH